MEIQKQVVWAVMLTVAFLGFQGAAGADVDVEMQLNDGGFVSFDHFQAQLILNNDDRVVPDAEIFGLLEILGEYYYWPDYSVAVNFQIMDIEEGEMSLTFLEFDFPDIDDVIPFGPMAFWGAWYVDQDEYGYDVKAFWLDSEHKWTPTPPSPSPVPSLTPTPSPSKSPTPTFSPSPTPSPSFSPSPTSTPTPFPTSTPTPFPTATPSHTPVPSTYTVTPSPPPDTPTQIPPTQTVEPTGTATPQATPTSDPTGTPIPTFTPGGQNPGDLVSVDEIIGNMRYVPATGPEGFIQGSPEEEPCRLSNEEQFVHKISRNIAVMETEVTRQMWIDLKAVQSTLPDDPSLADFSPTLNHPVQQVTWYEVILFANLLSLQNEFTQCYYKDAAFTIPIDSGNYSTGPYFCNFDADGYRLATEGEWEYTCRGGTLGAFSVDEPEYLEDSCGEPYCVLGKFPDLEEFCWFCANAPSLSVIVGTRMANPWNLKDMHGNVNEWCWDWYSAAYPMENQSDYSGPETGSYRVVRGGSWFDKARYCRSAFRGSISPELRLRDLGFRLVRVV